MLQGEEELSITVSWEETAVYQVKLCRSLECILDLTQDTFIGTPAICFSLPQSAEVKFPLKKQKVLTH